MLGGQRSDRSACSLACAEARLPCRRCPARSISVPCPRRGRAGRRRMPTRESDPTAREAAVMALEWEGLPAREVLGRELPAQELPPTPSGTVARGVYFGPRGERTLS